MKFLMVIAGLFPAVSFAVSTKDCPQTITVSYQSMKSITEPELVKVIQSPEYADWAEKQIRQEHSALSGASAHDYQNVRFQMIEAKRSQCRYLANGETKSDRDGDNETRLITKTGRDILRVSLNVGGTRFWVYHNVESYSAEGIKVTATKGSRVLGFFRSGGPEITYGWAGSAQIK
jgi:hypothetical protein